MRQTPTFTSKSTIRPIEYGECLAQSVIACADHDPDLADLLYSLVKTNIPRSSPFHIETMFASLPVRSRIPHVGLLIPGTREGALRRAEWLVARILDRSLPGGEIASRALHEWAERKENADPKSLIIGEIVGVIPTVGIGQPKKKKKRAMTIVRNDIRDRADLRLAEMIVEAHVSLLMRAIGMVKGNIKKIEPEMSDWIFGDKRSRYFSADGSTIERIEDELHELNVAMGSAIEDGMTAVLAISPAINEDRLLGEWGKIEPIAA